LGVAQRALKYPVNEPIEFSVIDLGWVGGHLVSVLSELSL
jgi:hypothetical protein